MYPHAYGPCNLSKSVEVTDAASLELRARPSLTKLHYWSIALYVRSVDLCICIHIHIDTRLLPVGDPSARAGGRAARLDARLRAACERAARLGARGRTRERARACETILT